MTEKILKLLLIGNIDSNHSILIEVIDDDIGILIENIGKDIDWNNKNIYWRYWQDSEWNIIYCLIQKKQWNSILHMLYRWKDTNGKKNQNLENISFKIF